jgi:O-6-methylguanine DNA methyltransferase
MNLLVERLKTPIGAVLITHDGAMICNTEFEDSDRREQELALHFPDATFTHAKSRSAFADALARYFKGDIRAIDKLPVAKIGTPFQQSAWAALRRIKAGETRSYAEQAHAIGRPNAARAVGRANALNPNAIVVPCHRVRGAAGDLTGYGGGLERKRWLIDHEARFAQRK